MLKIVLVLAVYELATVAGFYHWYIAGGVLFLGFWWLPGRWWWLLALGAILLYSIGSPLLMRGWVHYAHPFLGYWGSWQQYVYGNVAPAFVAMAGVACLRRWGDTLDHPTDAPGIVRLHIAALASSTLQALKDLAFVLEDGQVGDIRHNRIVEMVPLGGPHDVQVLGQFALSHFIGAFVGIMLLAPLAMWWCTRHGEPRNRKILLAGMRILIPMAAAYLIFAGPIEAVQFSEIFRLMLLVAVVLFALRFGWRGAALAILSASIAVAVQDHLGNDSAQPVLLQSFIAIAGAMGLMFGATVDDLRQQQQRLDEAQSRATALAEALASAAGRNLQAEERERRRLATELHDEFGQNLTALQTHLKLAQLDFVASGRPHFADVLLELTRAMRRNIAGVLESLRPAALDEIGLFAAIDRGAVRGLAEDAGLAFETRIEGDARLLDAFDETHRIAAYRLAQEAVTNVVRHAHAAHCGLRLRINRRNRQLWLFLDIRDDGIGTPGYLRPGHGLTGMRDRAIALDGRLYLRELHPGMRVHALLRQQLAG